MQLLVHLKKSQRKKKPKEQTINSLIISKFPPSQSPIILADLLRFYFELNCNNYAVLFFAERLTLNITPM